MRLLLSVLLIFTSASASADDLKPIAGCFAEKANCNASNNRKTCLLYQACNDQLQSLHQKSFRAVTDRDLTAAQLHERLRRAGAFTHYDDVSETVAAPVAPAAVEVPTAPTPAPSQPLIKPEPQVSQ